MAWDFSTEPEFQAQLDWMRDFVREEIWPLETVFDELGQDGFMRAIAPLQEQVRERGLWAAHLPPELGGQGFGQVKLGLMHEILGSSPFAPVVFGNQAPDSGNSEVLALAGTDDQKEQWLHPLLAGDLRSAFSMTEPDTAGSDPTLLQTRAVEDGDGWVINGHKWFSTNASVADFLIVMAVTDPEAHRYQRASMFIVPVDTPGVRILRDVPTMEHPYERYGAYGGHAEILYEDVRVPKDALLGARGAGFLIAQQRLGPGRIHHCMRWLGVSRRAFDMLCERALSRYSHGSLLADKQTVQNWIADSAAEMHAARLMTLHAAWKMDTEGASAARQEIALIKFYGAKVLHDVVDRALQAHGVARLLDRPAARADVPLRARRPALRRARRGAPPERRAPDPARLRGAGGRRPERARPDPPRGRPSEVRGSARGGDLQRLGRSRSSPPASSSSAAGLVVAAVTGAFDGGDPAPARAAAEDRPLRPRPRVRRPAPPGRARAAAGRLRDLEAARRVAARRGCRTGGCEPLPGGLQNVVGSIPGRGKAILVAAHYDTKDIPGFVGANDGAGGTAAVLEIARAMQKADRPADAPPIRFVLFDGEESPDDSKDFYSTGLRGSKPYARRHADELRAMILLDFVAEKGGMRIPREDSSHLELWGRLRAAARKVGAAVGVPRRDERRGDRRPHAVPAPRRAGDRPDRLHVHVLAQDVRRHERRLGARARPHGRDGRSGCS